MKRVLSVLLVLSLIIQTTPLPLKAETVAEAPEKKHYIAVMDFEAGEGMEKDIGRLVGDKVRETILNTKKYIVIDRANVQIIMTELAFAQTALCDQSCAVQIGRALSAHLIITGRVNKLGAESCQVSGQLTDVERTDVVQTASEKCGCGGEDILAASEAIALTLMGIEAKMGTLVIQTTPVAANVFVDGDKKGVTPINVKVKPGSHKIIVAAKGYGMLERVTTVAPGITQSLNFSLKKEKRKWYAAWWFYTIVGVVVTGGVAAAVIASSNSGHGGGENTPTGTINVGGELP